MRRPRFHGSRLSTRQRLRGIALAVWVLLALPIMALPPESLAVCMMACSADDAFCCCKAFGHTKPFSATGEASYLSSHLPSAAKDLCSSWAVMSGGPQCPPPSSTAVGIVQTPPRPTKEVVPPALPEETALSAPALPRPPPTHS